MRACDCPCRRDHRRGRQWHPRCAPAAPTAGSSPGGPVLPRGRDRARPARSCFVARLGPAAVRSAALRILSRFVDLRLDLRWKFILRCLGLGLPKPLVHLEADHHRSRHTIMCEDGGLVAITSTTYKLTDVIAGL